jgi:hypothetical protein
VAAIILETTPVVATTLVVATLLVVAIQQNVLLGTMLNAMTSLDAELVNVFRS